jgi:hypothetical protein
MADSRTARRLLSVRAGLIEASAFPFHPQRPSVVEALDRLRRVQMVGKREADRH